MSFAKLDHGIVNSSIWSESLATRVLWITMLALKDENGFVGSSRSGLARIANIPQDDFDAAISCLESPDKDSRTSDNEGRRVEKIEGGWIVLNSDKYRMPEDKRKEYMREYMAKRRAVNLTNVNNKINAGLPSVSVSVSASVSESGINSVCGKPDNKKADIEHIIKFLNEKCGTAFRSKTQSTIKHISARLNEKYTLADFELVIVTKNNEWSKKPEMRQYLRPETLFGTKFESYLMAASIANAKAETSQARQPRYDENGRLI